jgi:hypothetical protein
MKAHTLVTVPHSSCWRPNGGRGEIKLLASAGHAHCPATPALAQALTRSSGVTSGATTSAWIALGRNAPIRSAARQRAVRNMSALCPSHACHWWSGFTAAACCGALLTCQVHGGSSSSSSSNLAPLATYGSGSCCAAPVLRRAAPCEARTARSRAPQRSRCGAAGAQKAPPRPCSTGGRGRRGPACYFPRATAEASHRSGAPASGGPVTFPI